MSDHAMTTNAPLFDPSAFAQVPGQLAMQTDAHCDACERPGNLYPMGGYRFCFGCFRAQCAAHGKLR